MRVRAGRLLPLAALAPLLMAGSLSLAAEPANETAYLDELAQEAARISQRNVAAAAKQSSHGGTNASTGKPAGSTDVLPPDLEPPAFEAELQDRYIGSYAFYEKLPESGKRETYDQYLRDRGIEGIREVIMSRFLKQ